LCYLFLAERDHIVDSAVEQAKEEFAKEQVKVKLSSVQEKFRAFKTASPKALAQATESLKLERMVKIAEKKIMDKQRLSLGSENKLAMAEALSTEIFYKPGSVLTGKEMARIFGETSCRDLIPQPPDCGDTAAARRVRRADGTCNNLGNPTLGAANTPLRRLIQARYDDGTSRPRGFMQSQRYSFYRGPFNPPLPSPRIASTGILRDRKLNDSTHSHLLMLWGAFFDHDLDFVPENTGCPPGCRVTDEFEGRCYPIPVPRYDTRVMVTQTGPRAATCHGFSRSLPACPPVGDQTPSFQLPPREQINQINHYIDASMIYSHDEDILLNRQRDTDSSSGLLRVGPPVSGKSISMYKGSHFHKALTCTPMHTHIWTCCHGNGGVL
jgi:hypothetical protein